MTTKRILTIKQKCQITAITIVKETWSITTSTKRIIKTSLTSKEQYVAKYTQRLYVSLIYQPKAAYDLFYTIQMTDLTTDDIVGLNKRLE